MLRTILNTERENIGKEGGENGRWSKVGEGGKKIQKVVRKKWLARGGEWRKGMVGRTEERLVRKNGVKREGSGEQGLWEERAKGGEKK